MKMPKPSPKATLLLTSLCEDDPRFEVKRVFGHRAAFVGGNICFGTYGPDFFVRLGSSDSVAALALPGARPFEPMAGRPMKAYVVLPPTVLKDRATTRHWIERAEDFVSSLPPKKSKRGH